MSVQGKGQLTEASFEIIVTRADGTIEQLGVVSYWHKNPIRRWWVNRQIRRRRGRSATR